MTLIRIALNYGHYGLKRTVCHQCPVDEVLNTWNFYERIYAKKHLLFPFFFKNSKTFFTHCD